MDRIKTFKINNSSRFRVKISGEHVWIYHLKTQEKVYTPNLHLEFVENDEDQPDKLLIKGLYSPNSAYWTLFMFVHFILAGFFIGFSMMAYTKSILDESYLPYLILMISIVMLWIGLYFFARYNRLRGLKQAYALENVFREWVKE